VSVQISGLIAIVIAFVAASPSAPPGHGHFDGGVDNANKEVTVTGTDSEREQDTPGEPHPREKPPVKYFRADLQQCALTDLDRPDPTLLDQACA